MAKKRRGRCVFCPHEGELTVEDGLPKWIGRAFKKRQPIKDQPRLWSATRAAVRPGQPDRIHTKWVGGPTVYKVPVVCKKNCNNGWMKDLEDTVKPFLEPIIFAENTDVELSEDELRALATWMTKTTLIYDLLEDDNIIATDADRRWFGKHQQPFPESRIWLAAYDGLFGTTFHFRRTMTRAPLDNPTAAVPYAQMLTLVIGFVVLQSIIAIGGSEGTMQIRRPMPNNFCAEVWPISSPVRWPPQLVFDDSGLAEFGKINPTDRAMPPPPYPTGQPSRWPHRETP